MGLVCRFGGVGHVVGCPEDPAARDGSRGQPGARLTVLARNEQLCHVQCEGDHAGEDQQPTGRPQHHYGGTGERQVACTKQKSEDRKIDCRRDKRRNPDRYTEPKSEIEDIAEAKEDRQPDDSSHDHSDSPDNCYRTRRPPETLHHRRMATTSPSHQVNSYARGTR